MKMSIEVKNIESILINLKNAEKGLTRVFKDGLKDEGVNMKLFAQAALVKAHHDALASKDTKKSYWNGILMDSIDSETVIDEPGKIEVVVGVNAEKYPKVADYAVPVEKGHKVGFKGFWKGYHYMEQTYAEFAPKIEKRMAGKLSTVIKAVTSYGTGWRNIATGQYAKALK